jgi:sugar diacid utilization regulator
MSALAQAQAVRAEAEAALAYHRNTLRYRLACRVAAPLDSLRAVIGGG